MSALQLTATLAADAQARGTVDGQWFVMYEFTQEGRRTGMVGTQPIGQGAPAAMAATSKALRLKRGMQVRVHGAALERDGPHIRVMGIDHVEAESVQITSWSPA